MLYAKTMINSKQELKRYITCEGELYGKKRPYLILPRFTEKSIAWKFQSLLRYEEYYFNRKKRICYFIVKLLRHQLGMKHKLFLPINVIDIGLHMYHPHNIMINAKKIGRNCDIQFGVSMVAGGHDGSAPIIGDNVAIGCNATFVGNIKIANGIAVGACSLVNKSFLETNIGIGGIPAKKISNNGSSTWGGWKKII